MAAHDSDGFYSTMRLAGVSEQRITAMQETASRIIVRGGCAHVLAGEPQCRGCAEFLRTGVRS